MYGVGRHLRILLFPSSALAAASCCPGGERAFLLGSSGVVGCRLPRPCQRLVLFGRTVVSHGPSTFGSSRQALPPSLQCPRCDISLTLITQSRQSNSIPSLSQTSRTRKSSQSPDAPLLRNPQWDLAIRSRHITFYQIRTQPWYLTGLTPPDPRSKLILCHRGGSPIHRRDVFNFSNHYYADWLHYWIKRHS